MNPKVLCGILVALSLSACAKHGPPAGGFAGGGGAFAVPVSAQPLRRGDIVDFFTVTGSIVPKQFAALSSVASGTVLSVGPQIGERVSKGELLVKIDDATLRAQLRQNQAQLESARARLDQTQANASGTMTSTNANTASARVADETARETLRRTESLFRQGYVSQSALDQARQQASAADAALSVAQVSSQNAALSQTNGQAPNAAAADLKNARATVDQAQAAVGLIQSQIAQTEVRAPFDGVVTSRTVDPGALAAPGTTLMEVAQLDPVFVDASISGQDLQTVRVGTAVTVTAGGTAARSWHGTVEYLSQAAEPGTLTYRARIPLANKDGALRGGMVATVSFAKSRKRNVLLASRAAVYQTEAGDSIFIIDGGKAKPVSVQIGLQNDAAVEVSGPGLKPGVQAILNHPATLQPGMPVQVVPAGPR
ncbi:MAG: efflux RND transporter periplasmic adaptor subunit [Candidatus Eremiobacteraeota bacterium]|nr:efflux RND transporter periplasmic adaptor subunit [Candidatus Eremiobacteraeota bacterium]